MGGGVRPHQERFARYSAWSGVLEREFAWVTFVGSKVRRSFSVDYADPGASRSVSAEYPGLNDEYFEWTDLVDSIECARDEFVMFELGAGFGRWVVNAGNFARQHRPDLKLRLVAVEAERTHFAWMEQHIRDNGLPMSDFVLRRAAVGSRDGKGAFQMGAPDRTYGEKLRSGSRVRAWRGRIRALLLAALGRLDAASAALTEQRTIEEVDVIALDALLGDFARVDLVDMDIQGTELEVLTAAADAVDRKVVRCHIETHTRRVEAGLRKLFLRLGWTKLHDYPMFSTTNTPWGRIDFGEGGLQTWVNPKLAAPY